LKGLAPSNQRTDANLFIEELDQSQIIEKRIFSFAINSIDSGRESKIIFGGYDMSYAKPNTSLTWNDLINNHYWSVELVNVNLGVYKAPLTARVAIIDTGTSFLLMPTKDFQFFEQFFTRNNICGYDKTNKLLTCLCT